MNEVRKLSDILNIDFSQYSAERDAEIEEMERKQAEREKIERYKRQAPERYWNERLDTYKAKTESQIKAKTAAMNFIDAVDCGAFCSLIFIGTVGTGKTHLALSIIRECGGLYRLSSNIVEELRCAKSFTAKETEAERSGSKTLSAIPGKNKTSEGRASENRTGGTKGGNARRKPRRIADGKAQKSGGVRKAYR